MQRSELLEAPGRRREAPEARVDRRALTASVAYALWEERKRRNMKDDPEADWYHAEELITDLWHLRPPDPN